MNSKISLNKPPATIANNNPEQDPTSLNSWGKGQYDLCH